MLSSIWGYTERKRQEKEIEEINECVIKKAGAPIGTPALIILIQSVYYFPSSALSLSSIPSV